MMAWSVTVQKILHLVRQIHFIAQCSLTLVVKIMARIVVVVIIQQKVLGSKSHPLWSLHVLPMIVPSLRLSPKCCMYGNMVCYLTIVYDHSFVTLKFPAHDTHILLAQCSRLCTDFLLLRQ